MKTCSKCHAPKPLDAFWRNKFTLDRRASQCQSCTREGRKAYAATVSGHARILGSHRRYRKAHAAVLRARDHARYLAKKGEPE